MTPSPQAQARIDEARRKLVAKALAVEAAPDFDACRTALSEVWFANHDLAETLNDAERETRDAALARLQRRNAA